MVYDGVISGRFVSLRSITEEDAEFSYNIRADEHNRDTVGILADSIEAQRRFIEWQMKEPGDYYFVILNKKGERIGLVGVYDIKDSVGEEGRFVCNGSPMESLETEVLMNDFIRDVLKLKKTHSVIYCNNQRHIRSQKKKGIEPVRYGIRNGIEVAYYERDISNEDDSFIKIRRLLDSIRDENNE